MFNSATLHRPPPKIEIPVTNMPRAVLVGGRGRHVPELTLPFGSTPQTATRYGERPADRRQVFTHDDSGSDNLLEAGNLSLARTLWELSGPRDERLGLHVGIDDTIASVIHSLDGGPYLHGTASSTLETRHESPRLVFV